MSAAKRNSPRSDDDRTLNQAMERYANGEDGAFRMLYAGLAPRLRPFLRRMTGSPEQADDLVQETFVRMHRARGTFGSGAAVVPWAYAIARNVYIDAHRARKARPQEVSDHRGDDDHATFEPDAGPSASGEEHAVARQTAAIVDRALREMTVARREAFVLIRYEGRSIKEAAQILGATEGAVKLRAFHAYQEIRAALEREQGGAS